MSVLVGVFTRPLWFRNIPVFSRCVFHNRFFFFFCSSSNTNKLDRKYFRLVSGIQPNLNHLSFVVNCCIVYWIALASVINTVKLGKGGKICRERLQEISISKEKQYLQVDNTFNQSK